MTEKQFEQLMEKLNDIARRLPPSIAPVRPEEVKPFGPYKEPLPWQPYDGLPREWGHTIKD